MLSQAQPVGVGVHRRRLSLSEHVVPVPLGERRDEARELLARVTAVVPHVIWQLESGHRTSKVCPLARTSVNRSARVGTVVVLTCKQ